MQSVNALLDMRLGTPRDVVRLCAATIYRYLVFPKGEVGNWSNLAIISQPHILNGPSDFRQ